MIHIYVYIYVYIDHIHHGDDSNHYNDSIRVCMYVCMYVYIYIYMTGWWFGTRFPYFGNNHPN